MTHDELTQGYHNLMAQLSNECAHIDALHEAVTEHATNLDQAEGVVMRMQKEKTEAEDRQYSNLTVDISNLYARLQAERQDAIAIQQEAIILDQKRLYKEISDERKLHVD